MIVEIKSNARSSAKSPPPSSHPLAKRGVQKPKRRRKKLPVISDAGWIVKMFPTKCNEIGFWLSISLWKDISDKVQLSKSGTFFEKHMESLCQNDEYIKPPPQYQWEPNRLGAFSKKYSECKFRKQYYSDKLPRTQAQYLNDFGWGWGKLLVDCRSLNLENSRSCSKHSNWKVLVANKLINHKSNFGKFWIRFLNLAQFYSVLKGVLSKMRVRENNDWYFRKWSMKDVFACCQESTLSGSNLERNELYSQRHFIYRMITNIFVELYRK